MPPETRGAKKNLSLQVWEFRVSAEMFESTDHVRKLLKSIAKRWVFQLEKGEKDGYLHYQGRMSLIKRARANAVRTLFGHSVWISPTVRCEAEKDSDNCTGEAFYQTKAQTRVEGPWLSTDPPPPVLTQQMQMFLSWDMRPWQKELRAKTSDFDLRSIDLVYDPIGGIGKSLFAEYMEYSGTAEEIPAMRMMDDIFQWVATRPIKPLYIVDMPRGLKKDKLGDFYSGLEVIKNGVAFDKRYTAKKIRFDRPRIIVFTNTLPNFDLMSKDRWRVWEIVNQELCVFNPDFFSDIEV